MVVSRLGEVKLTTPWLVVGDGEDWPLELEFTPKKSFPINGIQVQIQCRESATKGSGTTKSTRSHMVHEEVHVLLSAGQLSAGEKFHQSISVPLPDTAAYSFDDSDNEITWTAEVRIDIPMFPDWKSEQTLQLLSAEFFVDDAVEVSAATTTDQPTEDVVVAAPQNLISSAENTDDGSAIAEEADRELPESAANSSSTSPELLDLVQQINGASQFGSDREKLVAAWSDRELAVLLDVESVSSTIGISLGASYEKGQTVRGTMVDVEQSIEVLTRNDQAALGLSTGVRCLRRIRPTKWDSLHDRLIVLDITDE
jgi:hypothetical protein